MERRGVCGAGRWAVGGDLQAVPVGVDGTREVRATYRQGRDGVDRAAVEDAAFEQGNSAGAVGVVPAASLFIGSELYRAGADDVVGEETAAGAGRGQHHAAPAGQGCGDAGRLWGGRFHLPGLRAATELRWEVSGDRELDHRA